MERKALLLLACVLLATGALAKPKAPQWPEAPFKSAVAVAKLSAAPNKTSSGKGYLNLFLVRPDVGPSYFNLILEGSMKGVTMAHIHVANASANNPIRLGLFPKVTAPKIPVLLNPPLTYKGTLNFTAYFNATDIGYWGSAEPLDFLMQLSRGELYVNVHTVANPGGEVQGRFACKDQCMWPVCSAVPGYPC
ncbi:hypothetical protein HXX76_005314 [Chlamydomonas incerta]|uniref:CHRD domain-containing protein n=1 Tax=Chlamydomonas incerta TaxID=51695 RepID=A0A835T4H4_CHLIN|nr:hypothetical protein HXX76_005314 [Chlamydomonas incerta]|eukprot:KAG2438772.1 hypothetical protein HXX76_005314 [Chlamydomonas incerta]